MLEYHGITNLGVLLRDGVIQPLPKRPWIEKGEESDISDFLTLPDMSKWTIGNLESDEQDKLKWHVIKNGYKKILICDRVILINISIDTLHEHGLVYGEKIINISSALPHSKLRLMMNGSEKLDPDEFNIPEIDEVIKNNSNKSELKKWLYIYSWCQKLPNMFSQPRSTYSFNGYGENLGYFNCPPAYSSIDIGWRPVLEFHEKI